MRLSKRDDHDLGKPYQSALYLSIRWDGWERAFDVSSLSNRRSDEKARPQDARWPRCRDRSRLDCRSGLYFNINTQVAEMLQIISGKFFGDGQIREQEFDSIIYSNFSWMQPVAIPVGELRPADARGTAICSYVFRYTMRYEQTAGDILAMPSGDEAAEHFRLLASLWFKAFFHPDRYHVEMLCRQEPRNAADGGVPSRFLNSFFDNRSMSNLEEVEGFVRFIDKVTGMPRKSYRLFISCVGAFIDALEAIDTNRDLAYSMFVYALEALTQSSDGFAPTWDDYPQDTRLRLDKQFAGMQQEHVDGIKASLLNNPHLKLMKRFMEFIDSHIEDSFFMDEAQGRAALPKNELLRALANLYKTRSGYVHSLRPIQQQLRLPNWGPKSDYFPWDNEPYLTFSGLARLVRHVFLRFVDRQPSLATEDYPRWRSELPGMIEGRMAPKYWMARIDNLHKEQAVARFNGFVAHFASHIPQTPFELPDVRPLTKQIEALAAQSSPADRKVWLCLYWLCNCIISKEHRRPNWETFLAKYESETDICSIELLAGDVLLQGPFQWPVEECEEVFERYLKRKFKARAINLPRSVEVAIMSELANMQHAKGDTDRFNYWIDRAILDAAGSEITQAYLLECREGQDSIRTATLLRYPDCVLKSASDSSDGKVESSKRKWIKDNAYFRWVEEGCEHGHGVRHWREAEAAFAQIQSAEANGDGDSA
jgi:Protein of unknown function (DUF2934)